MSKKSALFISSLLSTPLAYALEVPFDSFEDFGDFIGTIGQVLHSLVTNQYSSFFILAIILFILLYNIFRAPLKKIPVFEGTPGKSIAVALTLLAELGLFYKARETGIDGLLSGIFGTNNLFVGVVIAALLFLFWRKSLGHTSNNKRALFFTGISCFALDSLLQTPLMSTIGLSLIVISAIWFVGSKTRATTGKTFTKRFKEELKKTKKLEKKGKAKAKDRTKDEKEEEDLTEDEMNQEEEELNLYKKLMKTIEEQIKNKSPLGYFAEVQSLLKRLDASLKESIHLYNKEHNLVVDEIKKLKEEELIEGEIISNEEELQDLMRSTIDNKLTNEINKFKQLSTKINHFQKIDEEYNANQIKLLVNLVKFNKEIQNKLLNISNLQNKGRGGFISKITLSYNEAKNLEKLFSNIEKALKKKKHLLDKQRKLTKIIKHFQKKEKKDTKELIKQ